MQTFIRNSSQIDILSMKIEGWDFYLAHHSIAALALNFSSPSLKG